MINMTIMQELKVNKMYIAIFLKGMVFDKYYKNFESYKWLK